MAAERKLRRLKAKKELTQSEHYERRFAVLRSAVVARPGGAAGGARGGAKQVKIVENG